MTQFPSADDYVRAVQVPSRAFADAELQRAEFEVHPLFGVPMPASGSTALVFKARVAGEDEALRFFLREDAFGGSRYTALGQHLDRAGLLRNVARAKWADRGIRVGSEWFPMIRMEWVDGRTLDRYVDHLVRTTDREAMGALAASWRHLVGRMQAARFAHGDLEHGNVLVDKSGTLRLVDFDGSWIPAFEGMTPPKERGHRNYQRPDSRWGPWMDTFPGLVIYLSLVVLSHDLRPWTALYNFDNLLFRQRDFNPHVATATWRHLSALGNPEVDRLAHLLRSCCHPAWTPEVDLEALLESKPRFAVLPRRQTPDESKPLVQGDDAPAPSSQGEIKVFLCHSSGDKERVRELYRQLTEDGIRCWFDEEDLLPGQDWDREIAKALGDCRYVLACLSRSSITKAGYVQKELKRALDLADEQPEGSIFLIPVRLEMCEVPDRLKRLQWADLFLPTGYQRLLKSLKSG